MRTVSWLPFRDGSFSPSFGEAHGMALARCGRQRRAFYKLHYKRRELLDMKSGGSRRFSRNRSPARRMR
jgi:hypothetical protein